MFQHAPTVHGVIIFWRSHHHSTKKPVYSFKEEIFPKLIHVLVFDTIYKQTLAKVNRKSFGNCPLVFNELDIV